MMIFKCSIKSVAKLRISSHISKGVDRKKYAFTKSPSACVPAVLLAADIGG